MSRAVNELKARLVYNPTNEEMSGTKGESDKHEKSAHKQSVRSQIQSQV